VRSLSGGRIAGFVAPGNPQGVALGARAVAVLTRKGNLASISVFEAATGRLRLAVPVNPNAALAHEAITGHRLILSVGRTIRSLDLRTYSIATLGIAAAYPRWLSVSGRRVAWGLRFAHGDAPESSPPPCLPNLLLSD
jgi:hypothetical protein